MDTQNLYIIGCIVSVLLSVNAYFFRDMVKSLKLIELEIMKLSTQHDRVLEDVEFLLKEHTRTSERLHTLEGKQFSIETIIEILEHNQKK
jgi:hypothetical protein